MKNSTEFICPVCGKKIPQLNRSGRRNNGPIFRHIQRCPDSIEKLAELVGAEIGSKQQCWLPTSSKSRAKVRGGVRAHVMAYELTHGPVPQGMVVCHTCDVMSCINPSHLWAGTQTDNIRDMMSKDRGRGQIAKGNVGYAAITTRRR